jgi:hypothetical protein
MPGRYFTSLIWITCCFFFAARAAGLLELVLPPVHHFHDRRTRRRRHLHQVELSFRGQPERLLERHDSHLCSVMVHQTDGTDPDHPVHPDALFARFLLLIWGRQCFLLCESVRQKNGFHSLSWNPSPPETTHTGASRDPERSPMGGRRVKR